MNIETKELIGLKTRYGVKNYLAKLDDNTYLLEIETPYIGHGTTEDGKEYIDPSGGPFITVGDIIKGREVVSFGFIRGKGLTITFK